MALFDLTTAGDALNDLFDRERKAILGGRFDVLERLAHEKERLFDAVQRKPGAPDQLARLRGKLIETAICWPRWSVECAPQPSV